jgi:hypothetical protein
MAFLAIEFLFDQSRPREDSHYEIWEEKLPRELRIRYAQRLALRTSQRIAQRAILLVPFVQEMVGALEVHGGDFEAHEGRALIAFPEFLQTQFVVNFRVNSSAFEPLPQRLRFGALTNDGDRKPVHTTTSDEFWENQEEFGLLCALASEEPRLIIADYAAQAFLCNRFFGCPRDFFLFESSAKHAAAFRTKVAFRVAHQSYAPDIRCANGGAAI